MPLLVIANYALAITCAVHAVRTGRNTYWLFILLAVPGLGPLVYIIAELLPEMMNSSRAQKAGAAARKALDPGKELREAKHQLEVARTPDALKRAADAALAAGDAGQAVVLYQEAARGPYEDDTTLLFGLAGAQFAVGAPEGAIATLDRLRAAHPRYRNPEAHLIYARSLDTLDRFTEALGEYEALAAYYPGAEARARWALLLERMGRAEDAQARWQEILAGARIAPKFARRAQKTWIDMARARQ